MSDPTPPAKTKRVTKRQKRIVRASLKHPTETKKEIGSRLGMPASNVSKELAKPHVRGYLAQLMENRPKLADDALLKKLEEGLDALKTEFFSHEAVIGYEPVKDEKGELVKNAKGETKMRAIKDLKIVTRDCIDFPTRHRYLDTALELKGHKVKKVDHTSNGDTIKALLLEDD